MEWETHEHGMLRDFTQRHVNIRPLAEKVANFSLVAGLRSRTGKLHG